MYAALLDACVLVPSTLCDTLLRLAEDGFYRPLWSERILFEVEDAVHRVHPDLPAGAGRRRTSQMNVAFDDANVLGWEQASAGIDLPDPNDRHVLAAALVGGAQAIVTFNLKDFPEEQLSPWGIETRHPDEFLLDQLDLFPSRTMAVLIGQAASLRRPAKDLAGLLNGLALCGVGSFVEAVRRQASDDV